MRRGTAGRDAVTLAFLGILVGAFLYDLFSAETVPLYGDLVFFVLPMKRFLAEQIRVGALPLWNPWIYLGTPFLAGLQTGVFYPPTALLALPFPLGFNLFILAHYLVALVGTWMFLRDRSLSRSACGVGSLTFALGGYLVSMMAETNHLQAGVWAPWVLLFWTRYCRARRLLDLAMVVSTMAVELLGGSPETLLMTLAVAGAWSLRRPREGFRQALVLCGALGLALLVTAFQILPTAEYIAESDRSQGLSFAEVSAWSLEPISLLQLVLPRTVPTTNGPGDAFALGFETYTPWIQSLYVGIIPLCLAFAGLVGGRDRGLWAVIVAIALLFALGSHSPVLSRLYELAPSAFGRFRYPQKAYFLVHLGAAVLAAEGCEAVARSGARGIWTACLVAAVLFALGACVLCAHWADAADLAAIVGAARGSAESSTTAALTNQVVYLSWRLTAIIAIFLAIVLLRRFGVLAPKTFDALLMLVVATDLGTVHHGLHSTASWAKLTSLPLVVDPARLSANRERVFHYQTSSASFPGVQPESVRGLQELDRVRPSGDDPRGLWFDTWRILFADIGMVYGVGNISGGDGIGRRSNAMLLQALSSVSREEAVRLLGLYSVGWLIGPTPLEVDGIEPAPPTPASRYYVYRLTKAMPAARLVSDLDVVASDGEALRRLLAADFAAQTSALVDRIPPGWSNPPKAAPRPAGLVRVVAYGSDEVTLDVDAAERAFLVLNDSYFPGWEARVDGNAAEIFRTNVFVRGLPVPSGHHRVEFRYRPASFTRGALLSVLGLLGLGSLAVAGIRDPRRSGDRRSRGAGNVRSR